MCRRARRFLLLLLRLRRLGLEVPRGREGAHAIGNLGIKLVCGLVGLMMLRLGASSQLLLLLLCHCWSWRRGSVVVRRGGLVCSVWKMWLVVGELAADGGSLMRKRRRAGAKKFSQEWALEGLGVSDAVAVLWSVVSGEV